MSEACGNVIEQLASASEICHNAWAFGMSYSKNIYSRESQDHDSKKIPQSNLNSKPFLKQGGQVMAPHGGKSSSSNYKQDIKKSHSKYEPSSGAQGSGDNSCYICGFRNHKAAACLKKDMTDNIHLNFDLSPYRKSSAWQRLLADHPNLISDKILDYPRYISGSL